MMDFKVILTIFVIVSSHYMYVCHADGYIRGAGLNRSEQVRSSSWVFIDTDEDTDARFTRPPRPRPVPLVDPNPCNRKLPEKPNFNVPGRRISEAKCEEFQWDIKRNEEKTRKREECIKYKEQNNLGPILVPAVVGGRTAEPGEFPHMGALGWRAATGGWNFLCGCSLISNKFALTAAHCSSVTSRDTSVANTKPEIVRLAVRNIDKPPAGSIPYDGDILQVIVHPQYAAPRRYFDIALVELKYELMFLDNYIQPACLWTQSDTRSTGPRVLVTGWGYLDADRREKASELQVAEVYIIESKQCQELHKPFRNRNYDGLKDNQLCAGVLRGGVDTCQGDSGGPLQVKIPSSKVLSSIVGVTSFGIGCARAYAPGVYTRVSSFIDWIENIVWK